MLTKQKVTGVGQNVFPYIDDVRTLDESDIECLKEIKEVLKRHARLERFGVSLLHKHFYLSEDECLVEETDVLNRCQVISVKRRGEVPRERIIETVWQLGDTPNAILGCERECVITYQGQHSRKHVQRPGG